MNSPDASRLAERRATPRPAPDGPQAIRRVDTAHHVWGDPVAGWVTDRVYVSSFRLHVLEFELPPGGEFRHSELNPTVFGADVAYLVLDGVLTIADPSSGEVRRVPAGSGVFFREGTWHEGFNPERSAVRVLEFFSPPPARGTSSAYARRQPPLGASVYHDRRWERSWPSSRASAEASGRLRVVTDDAALWSFRDRKASHLRATLVDTQFLTVDRGIVAPGHAEDFVTVVDEAVLVCTSGELWVDVQDSAGGYSPACLEPGDAMFLPVGTRERVLCRSAGQATYLRGTGRAPDDWQP